MARADVVLILDRRDADRDASGDAIHHWRASEYLDVPPHFEITNVLTHLCRLSNSIATRIYNP